MDDVVDPYCYDGKTHWHLLNQKSGFEGPHHRLLVEHSLCPEEMRHLVSSAAWKLVINAIFAFHWTGSWLWFVMSKLGDIKTHVREYMRIYKIVYQGQGCRCFKEAKNLNSIAYRQIFLNSKSVKDVNSSIQIKRDFSDDTVGLVTYTYLIYSG